MIISVFDTIFAGLDGVWILWTTLVCVVAVAIPLAVGYAKVRQTINDSEDFRKESVKIHKTATEKAREENEGAKLTSNDKKHIRDEIFAKEKELRQKTFIRFFEWLGTTFISSTIATVIIIIFKSLA